MKNLTIGVLGGMGTYATIHLFQQYAEVFPAEKEWERPRIIIDNRCTMPSRVRALLYNEKIDELVDEMSDSMEHLISAGCNRIILACNTSHLFLPAIYKKDPFIKDKVINIIDCCVDAVCGEAKLKEIYLLGSEGTIDSGIYQNAFEQRYVECNFPKPKEYELIRACIEAVKQKKYTYEIEEIFLGLVNRSDICILGCTELPILYERYKDKVECKVYDPLLLALKKIKQEYDDE